MVAACGSGSGSELRITPDRVLKGAVELPDQARLDRQIPESVAFATPVRGFLATRGGVLFATRDGGGTWFQVVARGAPTRLQAPSPTHLLGVRKLRLVESVDSGHHWSPVASLGFIRSRQGVEDLDFVDARHGWLAASPRLFRTHDGGRSWERVRDPCPEYFGGVSFVDATHGFLLCGSQPATIDMAKTLYETGDGGATWRVREASRFFYGRRHRQHGDVPSQGGAAGIRFRSDRDGLLATYRVGLYATHDGGHRWRLPLFSGDFVPISLAWPSERRIFAVLEQVGLVRSDDRGRHWRQLFPATPRPVGAIAPSSAQDALAAGTGGLFRDPAAVVVTHDGGRTWSRRSRVRGVAVSQLERVPPGEVWAAGSQLGRRGATGPLRVYRSRDDGRTWSRIRLPVTAQLGWLSVPDSRTVYVAVDRALYRSRDGGATWKLVLRGQNVRTVRFVTANEGFWLRGEHWLVRTNDGGKTWRRVRVSPRFRIFAIGSAGPRHWWIEGNVCLQRLPYDETPCRGRILRTVDGGEHWDLIRLREMPGAAVFSFLNSRVGWAGDPWSGPYRTLDGGRTWRLVYPRLAVSGSLVD